MTMGSDIWNRIFGEAWQAISELDPDIGLFLVDHEKQTAAADTTAELLKNFAQKYLPVFTGNDKIRVRFPWNRMFEADIIIGR